MWQEETLLLSGGRLGIFLKLAGKLKEVVITGMSVFCSWTSMTNASPNYATGTPWFWMVAPSEDAFVVFPKTQTTNPPHPQFYRCEYGTQTGFTLAFQPHVQLQPLARCPKAPSFLTPYLIHLPMTWTALQNKQSSEYCVRILGQMLNWCWLSVLAWIYQYSPIPGLPQLSGCAHSNTPHSTFKPVVQVCSLKGRIIHFLFMCCRVLLSKAWNLYQQSLTLRPNKTCLCIAVVDHGPCGNSERDCPHQKKLWKVLVRTFKEVVRHSGRYNCFRFPAES